MKKIINFLPIALAGAMIFAVSCSTDQETQTEDVNLTIKDVYVEPDVSGDIINDHQFSDRVPVTDKKLLEKIKLLELGDAPVMKGPLMLPDGNVVQRIWIGGDTAVTEEDIDNMISLLGDGMRQYRTWNLVGGLPRTISVIGYTGGSLALDAVMKVSLSWAINNYNALGTGLTFSLAYGTNWPAYDIVVYKFGSGAGGSAGFPSGGNPYQFVQIRSGTSAYGYNVTEHVIGHEIGHTVGFRHTDWYNRSLSCGSGGSEGQAGVGAVWIPGTPTGYDPISQYRACFTAGENGELSYYDRVGFNYLY